MEPLCFLVPHLTQGAGDQGQQKVDTCGRGWAGCTSWGLGRKTTRKSEQVHLVLGNCRPVNPFLARLLSPRQGFCHKVKVLPHVLGDSSASKKNARGRIGGKGGSPERGGWNSSHPWCTCPTPEEPRKQRHRIQGLSPSPAQPPSLSLSPTSLFLTQPWSPAPLWL